MTARPFLGICSVCGLSRQIPERCEWCEEQARVWQVGDRVNVDGITGTLTARYGEGWLMRTDEPQRVGERQYGDVFEIADWRLRHGTRERKQAVDQLIVSYVAAKSEIVRLEAELGNAEGLLEEWQARAETAERQLSVTAKLFVDFAKDLAESGEHVIAHVVLRLLKVEHVDDVPTIAPSDGHAVSEGE